MQALFFLSWWHWRTTPLIGACLPLLPLLQDNINSGLRPAHRFSSSVMLMHIGCILLPHIFTSFYLTKRANKHKWSQVEPWGHHRWSCIKIYRKMGVVPSNLSSSIPAYRLTDGLGRLSYLLHSPWDIILPSSSTANWGDFLFSCTRCKTHLGVHLAQKIKAPRIFLVRVFPTHVLVPVPQVVHGWHLLWGHAAQDWHLRF
jgi:hypothetical protein